MLTIKNPQKIIGQQYNDVFNIIEVTQHKHCYEFTLGYASTSPRKVETILLHRKKRNDGLYLMEYNGNFLPLNINEFDTPEKIIICMQTI